MNLSAVPHRAAQKSFRVQRRGGRALAAFVAALLLILVGVAVFVLNRERAATGDPPPPPAAEPGALPDASHPESGERTLFEGWDSPAAVLLFTGEQHGYLEPCGCTAGQVGGLGRRTDLVRMLRDEKHWPVAAFDIGGLLREERAKRPQEAMKFQTTRNALRLMDYDAQAIGSEELRFGADQLYTLYSEEQGAGDPSPSFVCANLTLFEERTNDYSIEIPDQFRLIEAGGLRIAVTAIVGEDAWMRVFPGGLSIADTLYAFESPGAALQRVIPLMQAEQPDVVVLLSHTSVDGSRDLAAQFPIFDVVVTAGGPEDGRREPGLVGETLILEVGQKGKAAGVLGVFPQTPERTMRFELVELNGRDFAHAPQMHDLFAAYVEKLNASHPQMQESLGPHPSESTFLGAEACRTCHESEYDIWKDSRHAHAFESLTTGRPDDEDDDILIVRTLDPECITCHATGWDPLSFGRFDSAFVDMETTPQLAGSQCENCHGPASKHVAEELAFIKEGGDPSIGLFKAREAQHLDVDLARENLCVQCHDIDNSPTFDTDEKPFDSFWWSEIAH